MLGNENYFVNLFSFLWIEINSCPKSVMSILIGSSNMESSMWISQQGIKHLQIGSNKTIKITYCKGIVIEKYIKTRISIHFTKNRNKRRFLKLNPARKSQSSPTPDRAHTYDEKVLIKLNNGGNFTCIT